MKVICIECRQSFESHISIDGITRVNAVCCICRENRDRKQVVFEAKVRMAHAILPGVPCSLPDGSRHYDHLIVLQHGCALSFSRAKIITDDELLEWMERQAV